MRKIIFTTILLCLVSIAIAEEYPVLDKQVEMRLAWIKILTTTQDISMKAVIDHIDGINGTDTSEIVSVHADFLGKVDEMEQLTTHIAINNAHRQIVKIHADFRQGIRDQMKGNRDVKGLGILQAIKAALEENSGEIEDAKDNWWRLRKENTMGIYDIHVERAQKILDKLAEHDYNTTEAEEKLAEIESLRDEYEQALEDRDNAALRAVHRKVVDLTIELKRIVVDLQVQVPKKLRLRHWINIGTRVVDRTDQIIDELEGLGMDVTDLVEIHTTMEEHLASAKEAFEDEDYALAKDLLRDVRDDWFDLRDAYLELLDDEGLTANLRMKLESTAASVEDAAEGIEEDL